MYFFVYGHTHVFITELNNKTYWWANNYHNSKVVMSAGILWCNLLFT